MSRVRRPYMAAAGPKKGAEERAPEGEGRPKKTTQNCAVSSAANAAPQEKPKAGRPSIYTPELAHEICERLTKPESMRSICSDEHMPDRATIARWMAASSYFAAVITHARELQAEALIDEAMDISDNPAGDFLLKPDGTPVPVWENVQRAKLRVDTRKWYAAKLAPKKFSETVTQRLTGAADGAPIQFARAAEFLPPHEVEAAITKMLDDSEREHGLASMPGVGNSERLRRLLASEKPLTPDLYGLVHRWKDREFVP